MAPSPSLRVSPGREIRGDNHKRGRSLEGGRFYREKYDDLALFNEMEMMGKDNFLLQSNDDFEDILSSKMRYFSSNNFGVSVSARGENSDLLNADGEKNDYDWLLTPPDTPLFRCLDDEMPTVTLAQRGRPQSKPITISRSSTMEKSYNSSRGSASPNRLSLSPRSQKSSTQSRGRSSSAPGSSPTPSLRGTTPPRGPSPPPRKSSTPVPRSTTPTSRRMSPGSGGNSLSFGKRGVSPVNKNRGNSASPKAKAFASIPDFSFDVPPNLRTSLGDLPSSYVRGSSPASRSVSSSYSHDHSKDSVASSGDDNVESLQSIARNISDYPRPRASGAYNANHGPSLSRKSTRPGLSSSAPKRSFDSTVRQMDNQRKSPQNMFRPLLSSVPSSTFYVGKSSSAYRSLKSRYSSVTSSSNASSDPGPVGAHDTEGLDHKEDDTASIHGKGPCMDIEDDIFTLEKEIPIGENSSQVCGPLNFDPLGSPRIETSTPEILETKSKILEVSNSVICSECGRMYPVIESTVEDLNLCPDCKKSEGTLSATCQVSAVIASDLSRNVLKNLDDCSSLDAIGPQISVPSDVAIINSINCDENLEETPITIDSASDGDKMVENIQPLMEFPNLNLNVSEGNGISILLKRSGSVKGRLVQSRSFTATSISFDDMSYVRDCPTSMRSSTSSFDIHIKHHRSGSSLSGTSNQTFHELGTNNTEIIVANDDSEVGIKNEEQNMASEIARFDNNVGTMIDPLNRTDFVDDTVSYENGEDFQREAQSLSDGEGLAGSCDGDVADVGDVPTHSQLETISEIEIENWHPGSPDSHSDDIGSFSSSERFDEMRELSTFNRSDQDVTVLVAEHEVSNHAPSVLEEPTVTVELGTKAESLTLEEATDAILFCSSIVQNIIHEASTIAIEKEIPIPLEGSRPTATILGYSNSNNINETHGKTNSKRTKKSQKTQKRRTMTETETETKINPSSADTYEKCTTRIVGVTNGGDSMKPPKLESKCNCTIM